MKYALLAAVAAMSLLAGQASAGSLSYTAVSYPTDNTVLLTDTSLGVSETVYAGQFNLTGAVLDGTSIGSFYAWCVDIKHDLLSAGTYVSGQAPLAAGIADPATIDEISRLIAEYTPSGDVNSAATQVAIWEIEYGPGLVVTGNAAVTDEATKLATQVKSDPLVNFGLTILDRGGSTNQDLAYVPEPVSAAMLGVGLLGLGMTRRQRGRTSTFAA